MVVAHNCRYGKLGVIGVHQKIIHGPPSMPLGPRSSCLIKLLKETSRNRLEGMTNVVEGKPLLHTELVSDVAFCAVKAK